MQAPGGPDEDASNGFKYGGWTAPYFTEANNAAGELMQKQMKPADLLLGRKTFEIFASDWPRHADMWPGINDVTKYVVSKTLKTSDWKNSVFLEFGRYSKIEEFRRFRHPGPRQWKPRPDTAET